MLLRSLLHLPRLLLLLHSLRLWSMLLGLLLLGSLLLQTLLHSLLLWSLLQSLPRLLPHPPLHAHCGPLLAASLVGLRVLPFLLRLRLCSLTAVH